MEKNAKDDLINKTIAENLSVFSAISESCRQESLNRGSGLLTSLVYTSF